MKYPTWLSLPKEESWHELFTISASHRSLFRETVNTPQMIFPPLQGDQGIWSDDPRMVAYQIELANTLTDRFPREIDQQGFANHNAVIGDFQSLRNRSGWYMNPTSVPMTSNRELSKELDLAKGFLSERDEKIFRELHRYMFRTIEPASMTMRKAASSGAPYFTSQVDEKKKALMVFNEYATDILPRFAKNDLKSLFQDYGLFFATYMGRRIQPDGVIMKEGIAFPKPREANDELFARSKGAEGTRRPADKTVYDQSGMEAVPGIFAMRQRPVYAYPAMYNYFLTQFFTPLRGFYLRDAEFTFKHRDPASIVAKLEPFESIQGYDVKQFDQSIQPWLIDEFVNGFSGFLKEEVVFFLGKVLRQPYYQPHPEVKQPGRHTQLSTFNPCFGDPFDLNTFNMEVGLPSGIGPNPDMGKFFMTFAYLCAFDRHFNDVLEVGIQTILKGRHTRYALLDMGDDAVLATNDSSFWATADRVFSGNYYVRIEPEDGISFLGNVLYKDRSGRLRAAPNVITFIRNRLCPEHGVQHFLRRDFAGTGWYEGKKHYSSAPLFGDVWSVWDDIHRKHFHEGLDVRWYEAERNERRRNVPSLSDADIAVLENPDKLYYRYSIEEIHPWVIDQMVGAVAFEDYFPSIEGFFV